MLLLYQCLYTTCCHRCCYCGGSCLHMPVTSTSVFSLLLLSVLQLLVALLLRCCCSISSQAVAAPLLTYSTSCCSCRGGPSSSRCFAFIKRVSDAADATRVRSCRPQLLLLMPFPPIARAGYFVLLVILACVFTAAGVSTTKKSSTPNSCAALLLFEGQSLPQCFLRCRCRCSS